MICLHFLTTPPWKSLGGCDGSSILLTRKSVWMMTDRCWLWPNAFLLQLFVIILVLWARKSTREGVRYRIGPPHIPLSKCPISKDIINASSSSDGLCILEGHWATVSPDVPGYILNSSCRCTNQQSCGSQSTGWGHLRTDSSHPFPYIVLKIPPFS